MNITIRELNKTTQFDEISFLVNSLLGELFGDEHILSEKELIIIQNQWCNSDAHHWAYKVELGQEVVGFFTISQSFALYTRGFYGVINEFWVEETHRSEGIGKKIIQFIVEIAKRQGWLRIDVTAPSGNEWLESLKFYRKNHFIDTGIKLKLFV